jgi:DNA ligase-1
LKELKIPDFVRIVDTIKCRGSEHLKEYFNSIVDKGGEGVILREPQSLYKAGRSESLRKFKPFLDAEVKVIENNYPHGFNCLQYII